MTAKIVHLPGIADPNIDQIFEESLAEQRERLESKTQRKYEEVIRLLRYPAGFLNSWMCLKKSRYQGYSAFYTWSAQGSLTGWERKSTVCAKR
jgi:hypothetical protein